MKLSVLDLAPVPEEQSPREALRNTTALAQRAEALGYVRYWLAEHHNMEGIASSATAVVIGHVAGATERIRVGAGGIMLPNHAPLIIAEQFGTLETLYPGRIDLGLGRAPGTDPLTSQALRRTLNGTVDHFPEDVRELQLYFSDQRMKVQANPGHGLNVPIWILGSSLYGASLAAAFGLPYAFASPFAPAAIRQAIELYRNEFKPSAQLQEPYVMLGYNVCAAATEEEAIYLRSSSQQAFLNLRMGRPGKLPKPVEGLDERLSPQERAMLAQIGSCSSIGTLEQITESLAAFQAETQADELMIVGQIYDTEARIRSHELAMAAARAI